jgi:hypothetical protein
MKKLIVMMMLLLPMLLSSCTKGDEVWGLHIGDSRSSVAETLKEQGLEIENFSDDSYISVDEKVKYQGIEWDAVTCWFDKNNKLKGVEFVTFSSRPAYQIETLGKYIKEEGYPELKEDEECSGFYISDKLPMTVMLSLSSGFGGIRLHYCKDAHKKGE